MRVRVGLAVGLLLLSAGCVGFPIEGVLSGEPSSLNATVTDVVDGDTVDVRLADGSTDRVRLLGVDTPEVHVENQPDEFEGVPATEAGATCLREVGTDASAAVDRRLDGEQVRLEFDPLADRRGGYDRLLAYVVHENESINYWLVAAGYARVYDTEFAERSRYDAAENDAQAASRGVWNCTAA
jgi:micrococcal nuclease